MSIGSTLRICSKFCFISVMIVFIAIPSFSQGVGTIRGRVLDLQTGEPLPAANILIVNTSIGTVADPDGRFVIRDIPAGAQSIRVSYLGYASIIQKISVAAGKDVVEDYRLTSQALEGETVVITAQAKGQESAINQQLVSNTISNIVSEARLKELPDVNAAESIGRLPGISIDRYNGEATGVAIRGLAPKYSTVTVNGVALPATNNNDRSVDLSLVSSNLLAGIEVKKANTPDMDADALGGTIDLRLKEAPEGFQTYASLQGGNNQLNNYYGNYNTNLSVSNRIFDNDLGVIAGVNVDRYNRSADKLSAAYVTEASNLVADNVKVNSFTKRREDAFKSRFGGNVLLDYRIPNGKIAGNGFYSQAKTDGVYRSDQLSWTGGHNTHYFNLESNISTTSIFTTGIGVGQDFGWIKYDIGFSSTGSKTDDPNDYRWQFSQEDHAMSGQPTAKTPLLLVDTLQTPDDSTTGIKSVFVYSTKLIEKQKSTQFNVQVPFRISDDITGYVKAGGKFRWIDRTFDQDQWGHDNLQYGGSWTGVNSELVHALSDRYPGDFNLVQDSTLIKNTGYWNQFRFNRGYTAPANFLGGQYRLGTSPDLRLLREVTDVLQGLGGGDYQQQPIGSLGHDYDGIERYQAFYLMTELNVGTFLTILPGVRYDADYTKYHGQSIQEVVSAGNVIPPTNIQHNENIRRNEFWLPIVHVQLRPFDWLNIRLAGTETVTRPDYSMYAPISTIDQYSANVQAANGSLRDSRSKNLDASISVYQNYTGLITVSGFYKSIDDLMLYQGIDKMDTTIYRLMNSNLNMPLSWLKQSPKVNTWVNNKTPAVYKGAELDWQTNFWYLPSFLKGLVFDFNWTYITSSVDVKAYLAKFTTTSVPDPLRPGRYTQVVTESLDSTLRTNRMPDQPSHILNSTIGYDYGGFSIRVSYLYQSDKVAGVGETAITDAFTDAYERWDAVVQQKIGDNLQIYANFTNLNNRHDASLLGYRQNNPTALEYYGRAIDIGLRLKF